MGPIETIQNLDSISHFGSWSMWLEALLLVAIGLLLIPLKVWAFVDSLRHPGPAYVGAQKLPKYMWCILLGIAVFNSLFFVASPHHLFSLIFTIAMLVYFMDVKPAVTGS